MNAFYKEHGKNLDDVGQQLATDVHDALSELYKKYYGMGYVYRDIEAVILTQVFDTTLDFLLELE